jgi:hypothetical protein
MAVPSFFHLMKMSGEGTWEVIRTFQLALYIALVYLLFYFWWLVIPVIALPPFIVSLLGERGANKARGRAEVK